MTTFHFTDHAIDRFVRRHAPDADRDDVRAFLIRNASQAVRLKERSLGGQTVFALHDYRLVTKHDARVEVVVTILPHRYTGGGSYDPVRVQDYLDEAAARERRAREEIAEHDARVQREQLALVSARASVEEAHSRHTCATQAEEAREARRAEVAAKHVLEERVRLEKVRAADRLLERAILRDWEKTERHEISQAWNGEKLRREIAVLRAFVVALGTPESATVLAQVDQIRAERNSPLVEAPDAEVAGVAHSEPR